MRARPVLVILQPPNFSPGLIAPCMARLGMRLDKRCPAQGDPLPQTLNDHQGVVILGGPMSAFDDTPDLLAQHRLAETALKEDAPLLGICLGAQILARVMGAEVWRHPKRHVEAGFYPLQPTPQGRRLFPQPLSFYAWHEDGFDLPKDALCLARGSREFPQQAFRHGDAFGFQFHPEASLSMRLRWMTRGRRRFSRPGAQPFLRHVSGLLRHETNVRRWFRNFLAQWTQSKTTSPPWWSRGESNP